jgi:hypothetical protein
MFVDANFNSLRSTNASVSVRPDVVPGQAQYIRGAQCISVYGGVCPGGRALNPASFMDPPTELVDGTAVPTRQGNLNRNARRALGLGQWDFSAHRDFPIHERLHLQFRGELFNILNHPNFGPFNSQFQTTNAYFGEATSMLNQYLGGSAPVGGQNQLYTPGGPRSGELALKLVF